MLLPQKKRNLHRRACIKLTAAGSFYQSEKHKIWCHLLSTGDLEMRTEPKGKAWAGIIDVHDDKTKNRNQMSEIKRHIRHQNAYKGGGTYGLFGGYDITLLELQRPFHGYKPACLPSPTFDDIRLEKNDSILAGFGAYHRNEGNTCQTNEFGKMKYHYCDSRSGNGSDACQNDSPPTMSQECDEFFKDKSTPNSFPTGVEEIRIIGGAQDSRTAIENGAPGIFCFPKNNPEKKEYGWCRTLGHYYQADIPGMDMNPLYSSWGFAVKNVI